MTIEDETGIANLVVWLDTFERFRRAGIGAVLLGVAGRLQREGRVIHVVAERLLDLTPLLRRLEADAAATKTAAPPLPVAVRDFH